MFSCASEMELTMMSGFPGRLSHATPVRLTQMVLKPNAPAPETAQLFDEKNVTSLGLQSNRSGMSWYTAILNEQEFLF